MRQLQSQIFTSVCQDLRKAGVSVEQEDLEERYVYFNTSSCVCQTGPMINVDIEDVEYLR